MSMRKTYDAAERCHHLGHFLNDNALARIEFEINLFAWHGGIGLSILREQITDAEATTLKKVFGPYKKVGDAPWISQVGDSVMLDGDVDHLNLVCKFTLSAPFKCEIEKTTQVDVEDEEFDRRVASARRELARVSTLHTKAVHTYTCTPMEGKEG